MARILKKNPSKGGSPRRRRVVRRESDHIDDRLIQLQSLHRVGALINSTFDLEEILKLLSDSMARDLDFDRTGVIFLDKTSQKPFHSAYTNFTPVEFRLVLDHYQSLLLPALGEEDVFIEKADNPPPQWAQFHNLLTAMSVALLPMRVKSRLIGFGIGVRNHRMTTLTEDQRRYFAMFSAQASTAIENARLYEALGQANLTLEEKVEERTRDLVQANERLLELDQIKSNFISMVSHELRTPLTAIKGFIVTLFHYDKEITAEKRHLYLGVLNEETDRLTRLITELLDISRIESGHMDMQWSTISIPTLVQRVFDTFAIKAESVSLIKDFPADFPTIRADSDKIEQILVNLIGNALKYSPIGGRVLVHGRKQGHEIEVSVDDEGPGIPASEQEKIFDKFYRQDNETNRKNPGTGLGLPICRTLINLHGGKIWVESEAGKGCHLVIRLPLNLEKLPR
jgi:signal transduction histidine kinase